MIYAERTLLCFIVLAFSYSYAQNDCTTRRGTSGQCILLDYCPSLHAISQKPRLTSTDRNILLEAQCGSQGTSAKVCCEDYIAPINTGPEPCRTPGANAPGTCISLKSCNSLYQLLLKKPISPDSIKLLQNSQCGLVNQKTPKVCCPNNQPITVTRAPPIQIPEVDTGNGPTPSSPLLPLYNDCGRVSNVDKVIGGEIAGLLEFPWMVLLEYQDGTGGRKFACGGTIISKRYILTAAHCVIGEVLTAVGTLVSVRVGEYDTSKAVDCVVNQGCNNGSTLDVGLEQVVSHPGYNQQDPAKLNDIALIRLERDLVYNTFVRPICLPNKKMEPHSTDKLFVAGWGLTETNENSKIKMKLKVPVLGIQNCQAPYEKLIRSISLDGQRQFCAGGEPDKDSCKGDSGGAAMQLAVDEVKGELLYLCMGVISFGPFPCGIEGVPGVYTLVPAHIDWILNNMRA